MSFTGLALCEHLFLAIQNTQLVVGSRELSFGFGQGLRYSYKLFGELTV